VWLEPGQAAAVGFVLGAAVAELAVTGNHDLNLYHTSTCSFFVESLCFDDSI